MTQAPPEDQTPDDDHSDDDDPDDDHPGGDPKDRGGAFDQSVDLRPRGTRRGGLAPRRHWGVVALAGGAMVGAALAALRVPALQRADVVVHDVVEAVGRPALDKLVVYTTDLGSAYAVLSAAGTLAARGRPRSGLDLAALGSTAWILAQNAKQRVRRLRPYEAHGVRRLIGRPTGSSFPSGHACVAAAWATMLADRAAVPGARRAFYGLAAWVALTRVYVGVHYPTDVIGGAGLGLALGALWRGPLAGVARRLLAGAQVAATGEPGPEA